MLLAEAQSRSLPGAHVSRDESPDESPDESHDGSHASHITTGVSARDW